MKWAEITFLSNRSSLPAKLTDLTFDLRFSSLMACHSWRSVRTERFRYRQSGADLLAMDAYLGGRINAEPDIASGNSDDRDRYAEVWQYDLLTELTAED